MKKSNLIIYIATALLAIGFFVTTFFVDDVNSIATITTTITAIIGAVALFLQFKKDKEVNQQSFILEFGKQFFEIYNCDKIYADLDNTVRGVPFKYNAERNNEIVRALEWCEVLASMVKSKTVTLESIDNLCAYRFFLITNSPIIQENELLKFRQYYNGIFWLHPRWTKHCRKTNQTIVSDETNLTDIIAKENENK